MFVCLFVCLRVYICVCSGHEEAAAAEALHGPGAPPSPGPANGNDKSNT